MAVEIERKYLLQTHHNLDFSKGTFFKQGYLQADGKRTVRVRISGDKAFLTIKGATKGFSRSEFEYEIPVFDAQEMMEMALYPPEEKVRLVVPHGKHFWEVDCFYGSNEGLILAEIELESEEEEFELPVWIAEEVTGNKRYYNSYLSKTPFTQW